MPPGERGRGTVVDHTVVKRKVLSRRSHNGRMERGRNPAAVFGRARPGSNSGYCLWNAFSGSITLKSAGIWKSSAGGSARLMLVSR